MQGGCIQGRIADVQEVRGELGVMSKRLTAGWSSVTDLEKRVTALEHLQDAHIDDAMMLQMHMEEMEDRSRRNNLRLRGLPEATGPKDLADTATAIFRGLPGDPLPLGLDNYRIHRALGPRSQDPNRPRDVKCRLHYSHKESIARKAWEAGVVDFDGAAVKILPDVPRATLQRRATLRPVLELARRHDATYRWGYPLSVLFRRGHRSFTLRETCSVCLSSWMQILSGSQTG